MFDFSITQLSAIGVAMLAVLYMFKDSILKTFTKVSGGSVSMKSDDSQAIKDLLDFRSRYNKGSLVYSKLTEVIEALLNKDE